MRILLAALALLAAWLLLLFRVDPVPTWFYVFAWYPTLVLLDAIVSRAGRPSLFSDRTLIVSLFAWSAVIWLVFEAANFRLVNWYYVSLPRRSWERWTGILLSFATVVPALVLAERVLDTAGLFGRARTKPVRVRSWELAAATGLGLGIGALALLHPQVFFPLIWGAGFLIADPIAYRRAPTLSLLADIERGEWGRILRLLVGGLGVGLVWEGYNYWADGKWIYTVPWLEHTKVFEMPPFGLLGFPVFALEAWSMYAALVALGVAVPVAGTRLLHPRRTIAAAVLAVVFAGATLAGMEHFTISSTVPRVRDLPGVTAANAARLERGGVERARDLASADPRALTQQSGLDSHTAEQLVAVAELTRLRGMGAGHAATLLSLGLRHRCALVGQDDGDLTARIRARAPGPRPTPAEVRVWIRAAQRRCGERLAFPP